MTSGQPNKPNNDDNNRSTNVTVEEDYGYYFYPEREAVGRNLTKTDEQNQDASKTKSSFWSKLSSDSSANYLKCVSNVYWCKNNNPMVKLLIDAIKSRGCDFNISRHVSCEKCVSKVNGGYDATSNQVVVCQNTSSSKSVCCGVLTHELVHMFDFCRAKVDFKNLEHLACTEIRAAAISHCSFISAFHEGDTTFSVKEKHQDCVRRKALLSVLMVRNIGLEEGVEVVEKVFNKCYNDLEPIGRVPRRNSRDPERIYAEGRMFGYVQT